MLQQLWQPALFPPREKNILVRLTDSILTQQPQNCISGLSKDKKKKSGYFQPHFSQMLLVSRRQLLWALIYVFGLIPGRLSPLAFSSFGYTHQLNQIGRKTHALVRNKSAFRAMSSLNAKEDGDNEEENTSDREEEENSNSAAKFYDSIVSSPSFGTFLFWTPFVANPNLRSRASNFIETNIGTGIVGPIAAVGGLALLSYVLYQDRIDDIELARGRTEDALKRLREVKSKQLSGDVDVKESTAAVKLYESTLKDEMRLRYIIAGVRVPGVDYDPSEREEDKAAAKQFLGMKITKEGSLDEIIEKGKRR